jgi:drug/metabolite transporter (DMT)-like permease
MDSPEMSAINFLYLQFVPAWLGCTPYVLATNRWADIEQVLRENLGRLLVMGLCDFTGYGAVLAAMAFSKVSYVIAFRQTAIVIGAIMGATLLKEKHGPSRVLGAAIIFLGAFLVSVSK